MEASAIDGAVEWQGLGASIFDDVPLVDAGCTSFILQIGGGTSVTVEPRRDAFDRTEVLSDDKLIDRRPPAPINKRFIMGLGHRARVVRRAK